MLPLIRERLQARAGAARETSIDAHARKLVTIDGAQSKSFAEFAAFDLALDEHAVDTLVRIRQGIATTDVSSDQLACLWNLVRLEANPEVVQRFMPACRACHRPAGHRRPLALLRVLAVSLRRARGGTARNQAGRERRHHRRLAEFST